MATSPAKAKTTAAPAEDVAQPKSKKKLLVAVMAVVVLAAGAGGWFFVHKTNAPVEHKAEPVKPPVFMPLETFVVNLTPEEGEQFLQVNMSVQVSDETQVETLKTYMPLIRNRIIAFLSNKKASEILPGNGKAKLAADLSELIKQPFAKGIPPAKVDGVFFTSFVVQ